LRTKVLVTGCDMITPAGLNLMSTWDALVKGTSCVHNITRFSCDTLETKIAAQVDTENFSQLASQYCKKRLLKQMTFVTRMGLVAAIQAVNDSGVDFTQCDKRRVAVILGVVNTGYNSLEAQTANDRIVKAMANAPSAWISLEYGIEGPNFPISTACASSAYAMAYAYDMIANGSADIVITGGTDSTICPEEIRGFNEILALSTRNSTPETACRPFTLSRDGFVMGEGSGVMIFESEEHAKKRGARVYAEIAGYALTSEAHNIVAPKPDGEGMAQTMAQAVHHAGVNLSDIQYVNAHGTSTPLNDRYETLAIKKVFGEQAGKIAISSTKSMIGHTIGAAGAIEGITTIMSIKHGIITPTINYEEVDPELDLDYVPNKAVEKDIRVALSNSFGFGGHNATLVFKKYE
jgi:3-oxoacyl-[acyl-carrier-protein] synthase II